MGWGSWCRWDTSSLRLISTPSPPPSQRCRAFLGHMKPPGHVLSEADGHSQSWRQGLLHLFYHVCCIVWSLQNLLSSDFPHLGGESISLREGFGVWQSLDWGSKTSFIRVFLLSTFSGWFLEGFLYVFPSSRPWFSSLTLTSTESPIYLGIVDKNGKGRSDPIYPSHSPTFGPKPDAPGI